MVCAGMGRCDTATGDTGHFCTGLTGRVTDMTSRECETKIVMMRAVEMSMIININDAGTQLYGPKKFYDMVTKLFEKHYGNHNVSKNLYHKT